jgi:hypothetical protein
MDLLLCGGYKVAMALTVMIFGKISGALRGSSHSMHSILYYTIKISPRPKLIFPKRDLPTQNHG